jgi:hypothetical protein
MGYNRTQKFPQAKIYRFRRIKNRDQDVIDMGDLVNKLLQVIVCEKTKGSKRKIKFSDESDD